MPAMPVQANSAANPAEYFFTEKVEPDGQRWSGRASSTGCLELPHQARKLNSVRPARWVSTVGIDAGDSHVHNYRSRWKGPPSQKTLVAVNRRPGLAGPTPLGTHPTGATTLRTRVSRSCKRASICRPFRDAHRQRRCIVQVYGFLRVECDWGSEGEATASPRKTARPLSNLGAADLGECLARAAAHTC